MLDETGPVEDCQIEGTFPMFGNNDKGIDQGATAVVGAVSMTVAKAPIDRNERHHPLDHSYQDSTAGCTSSSARADDNWT